MSRVDELLRQLTLQEKVSLTAGYDMWHTPPVERLGIPPLKMSDGPVGVRGASNTGGPPSACFPCGTALAATWDVDLVRQVGAELGAELHAKGAHVLLAPTVNIHRHPLAGRNFECYSEDPLLTARMAVAYISGVQSTGVGACIKHFVANDSEFERFTISSEVPERALREVYLRPFEIALEDARPLAVMASYNKLGGTWASEHPWLLTTVLRDEWGYDGLVISDWWATHTTSDAANAGLDLEMPGPTLHRGDALVSAVESGEVSNEVLDGLVRRVLTAMERTGALDAQRLEERADDTPERREVARRAASSAIVLLKNDHGLLPIDPAVARRVAVLGPNADALNILGGGSAAVTPYYAVSPVDGLRAAFLGAEVVHEPGCSITRYPPLVDVRWTSTADGDPGLDVVVVAGDDPDGTDVLERHVTRRSTLNWGGPDRPATWSARMTGTLRASTTGRHVFQGGSAGVFRISIDDEVVVDGWNPEDAGRGRRVEGGIHLVEGHEYALRADFCAPPNARGNGGLGGLEIRCQAPLPDDAFERAVTAARDADVAVVVVGTNGDWETEGRDRKTMDLPGRQVELIEAVAAANSDTIVVVNAGSPVAMEWVDRVPAVVQSWFLGQETGNAIADVLTGAVDASGRLPTTIPRALRDTPAFLNYPGEFGTVHYGEGLFVGYRWYDARQIEPQFPFGHGLSYTTFDYGPLRATVDRDDVRVEVTITNTGARDGVETVQLYVRDVEASVQRPAKQLEAFAKVAVAAGEARDVVVRLDRRAFAFWDVRSSGWRVAPGEFEILVGRSSRDIRQRTTITAGK
ncbi:MAG TPA: glycoside hydrolase family 3 C-terminal domain-containing protein [Acidimicrobiales bacterium]|jgi:beta-glucosidase|nr:glycoside hydrolase family 3 C-terminal domain-containing protein [Acidimicrobiales bacterium]